MSESIMDRIKTMVDVASELNLDLLAIRNSIMQLPIPEKDKLNMIADYHWEKIVEVLNEGWMGDYSNGEDKYWPYAWGIKKDTTDPSGFGFSHTNTAWTRTDTSVGVRLLFKEIRLAQYAITQFPEQFKACYLARRGK